MFGTSRGSAEPATQAMLFLVMIAVITAASTVGANQLDTRQESIAYEQNVNTLQLLNSNINELDTEIGVRNNSAVRTQGIDTHESSLEPINPTTITLEPADGSSTQFISKPLRLSSNTYNLVYDSGIIAEGQPGDTRIITSTFNNRFTTIDETDDGKKVISFVRINYDLANEDNRLPTGQIPADTLVLNKTSKTEVIDMTSGGGNAIIEVQGETPELWRNKLNKPYISELNPNDGVQPDRYEITSNDVIVYTYEVTIS